MEEVMPNNNLIDENVIVAFVDTSALDPMFNNYNNMEHIFSALKRHIASHKLILITHEIAVHEIESHIKEKILKQVEKYVGVQKSNEFALLKTNHQYDFIFNTINSDQIISSTIKAFEKKLKEIGIIILKTGSISVKKLIDDYFGSKPPFGIKDKKSEFPDAIMFQSLIKAVGEEQKTHIVANDGDWENVCKTRENLILHKNLNSLLDYINKDNIVSNAIKEFLLAPPTIEIITKKLDKMARCIDFVVDGLSYDRKGLVKGFSYDKAELLNIDEVGYVIATIEDINCSIDAEDTEITAIVTIIGSANVTFNCTYFDEEKSIWDSESHEYIYKSYGKVIETHEFLFPVRLTLTGDCKNNLEISNYSLIETDDINYLNNGTLIDREYFSEYYDPGFCVEKIFACPSCGKEFRIDLISDETECVSSSERQMGTEREYKVEVNGVCAHCGECYRITGELWEYPENCYNYEQNIEINKAE